MSAADGDPAFRHIARDLSSVRLLMGDGLEDLVALLSELGIMFKVNFRAGDSASRTTVEVKVKAAFAAGTSFITRQLQDIGNLEISSV